MKKLLSLVLVIAMVVCTVPVVFAADLITGLTGAGTESDPVKITSTADWNAFAASGQVASGLHFQLTADLDFAGAAPTMVPGTFAGHLDGNEHVIKNAHIDGANGVLALFEKTGNDALIEDLGVEDVTITPHASNVTTGWIGIVAQAAGGGTYKNCYISGIKTTTTFTWQKAWGGFVGHTWWTTGSKGLIFENCYVVTKAGQSGYITLDSMSGPNAQYFAPFASWIDDRANSKITYTNCYTDVDNITPVAVVNFTPSVTNTYYNTDNNTGRNRVTNTLGTASTTAEMKTDGFVITLGKDVFNVDSENINSGYPVLKWQGGREAVEPSLIAGLKGMGTEASPVLIGSEADWETFAAALNAAGDSLQKGAYHYKLTADLDFADYTWAAGAPFHIDWFEGHIDGDNHTISNFSVTGGNCRGLIYQVSGNAMIENLGMIDVTFSGVTDANYGAIAGRSRNINLKNCYVYGIKEGSGVTSAYGALLGVAFWANGKGVDIDNCYAVTRYGESGYIGSSSYVNGIVCATALSNSTQCKFNIANSYIDIATLVKAGVTGATYTVTSSYFNTDNTNNGTGSSEGSGRATTALKNSGFDLGVSYYNSDTEGTINSGYPVLKHQGGTEPVPYEPTLISGLKGEGTEADPVKIGTLADWEVFADATRANTTDLFEGKYFLLTADLDFAGVAAPKNAGHFRGVFDGGNHVIKNFTVTATNTANGSYPGLFYRLGGGSAANVIKNLGMVDVVVDTATLTTSKYAGSLVGCLNGGSNLKIENCFVRGLKFSGTNRSFRYGGLVGYSHWTYQGTIENCYVLTKAGKAGYVAVSDLGLTSYGDIIGMFNPKTSYVYINNCYGDTNRLCESGIAGWNNNFTESALLTNTYYNSNVSVSLGAGLGTAKTAAELKDAAMVTTLGAAFKAGGEETGGFPALAWETVTPLAVFDDKIDSLADLKWFAEIVAEDANGYAGKTVTLEVDIDLENANWTSPIGTKASPFKGTFDGKGHVISNYKLADTATTEAVYGIFGVIDGNAVVKNVGVKNVESVSANAANSYPSSYHGALVAIANGNAKISNCFAKTVAMNSYNGTVGARPSHGGAIVAYVDGAGVVIENCYSLDWVENNDSITAAPGAFGTMVSFAEFKNCYSNTRSAAGDAANNSKVTNVFYKDTAWNGYNWNWYGTQKTDDEIKASTGALGAAFGWDNKEGTLNNGYPMLLWEAGALATDPGLITKITSIDDLKAFAAAVNGSGNGYAGVTTTLETDLNLGDELWNSYMIGTETVPYQGTFDGKGHKVTNFKVEPAGWKNSESEAKDAYALFKHVAGNAVIKNLGVENVEFINTRYTWGYSGYCGGLVGLLAGNAKVDTCYAKNVSANTKPSGYSNQLSNGGGMIAVVRGEGVVITNCYALGFVEVNSSDCSSDGALVGVIHAIKEMSNCYADTYLGNVGTKGDTATQAKVTNSYCTTYEWYADGRWIGTVVTTDALKLIANKLGGAFATDKNNVNDGYPVFAAVRGFDYVTGKTVEDNTLVSITIAKGNANAGKVIVAAYDSNGLLLDTAIGTVAAAGGEVAIGLDITGAATVKAYILVDDGEATPMSSINIL